MNWATLREDLRLLPTFARIVPSLRRLARAVDANLGALLRDHAQRHPHRICLRFEQGDLTYAEFNGAVNAFAAVLRQAGVGREPVALVMENGPTLLAAQLAVAKTGAIAALVNSQLTGSALSQALRQSSARHVFTDATCLPRVVAPPESASLTIWGQGDPALIPPHVEPLDAALAAAPRSEPPSVAVRLDDVFLYVFTSGTSGAPKPALVRHRRFQQAGVLLGELLDIGAEDVIYSPLPLTHGESNLVGFSLALHAGATFASCRRVQADAVVADLHRSQATVLVYSGELCRQLLRLPAAANEREHGLRLAVGAGLRGDIWQPFAERFAIPRIVELYGLTEGNVHLLNLAGRPGSVGRPLPLRHGDVRLARCDIETGRLERDERGFAIACADGEVGELLGRITARALLPFEGYLDAKATEARIARNVFRHGDAYFRTGDLLRRDADGYFAFVDRTGDSFRWHGENVSSEEVAEVLRGVAGVAEAHVFGVEVPGCDGRAGMAVLVLAPGAEFAAAGCYRAVQALVPYAQPAFLRVVGAVERTGTLKPRKFELQRQGFDLQRVADPLYVRDDRSKSFVRLTPALAAVVGSDAWPL